MNTYNDRLAYIFNRPVITPAWYWQDHSEEEDPFNHEDPLAAFEFIERLCENPGPVLAPWSDSQVGEGLNYIFNNACSNLTHDFKDADVPFERRERALRAIFNLFRDVFAPRCPPAMSSGGEGPLSYICYMFWDVCPLSNWVSADAGDLGALAMQELLSGDFGDEFGLSEEMAALLREQIEKMQAGKPAKSREDMQADFMRQYTDLPPDAEGYYRAVADVMAGCLRLDNPACVESGLHGLGHLVPFLPDLAVPIIDDYLKNAGNQPKELVEYARQARTGVIQ